MIRTRSKTLSACTGAAVLLAGCVASTGDLHIPTVSDHSENHVAVTYIVGQGSPRDLLEENRRISEELAATVCEQEYNRTAGYPSTRNVRFSQTKEGSAGFVIEGMTIPGVPDGEHRLIERTLTFPCREKP